MKLSTTAKTVLGILSLAAAYRVYQLWKASGQLSYSPVGFKLRRDKLKFVIVVDLQIMNPTSTTINIRGIKGNLNWNNYAVSSFQAPPLAIKPGTSQMTINFALNNLETISALAKSVSDKKWPILKVDMVTMMPLFSYPESFDINTGAYAEEFKGLIFQ